MSSYKIVSYYGNRVPEAYQNLIFSKWLRSLRFGNDYYKLIKAEIYYHTYHHYLALVLQNPSAIVNLAVLSDDPDVVLGFSVSRGNILDYVHVQKDMRKLGIGTKLVPKEIDTVTHLTKTGLTIWGSKYKTWNFNPFA